MVSKAKALWAVLCVFSFPFIMVLNNNIPASITEWIGNILGVFFAVIIGFIIIDKLNNKEKKEKKP